jgi:hypothetical protein
MNNSELEALIQEKLKAPTFSQSAMTGTYATGNYVTTGYLTPFRTTLIEPVPETHDMAKLVADTLAKMKLEKAAPTVVMPDMLNTFGTLAPYATAATNGDPSPELIIESSGGRIVGEAKLVAQAADIKGADRPKSAPAAAPTPAANKVVIPERAPGAKLHSLAKFLLTAEAYRRYVEPHLADIYLEYNNALTAGDVKAANRVVWRGYFEVVKPFAYGLARSLFRFWLQTRR